MKTVSKMINGKVYFDNFVVVKESDKFYGVYQKWSKEYTPYNPKIITSGTTLDNACKKAKLLQIGYDLACNDLREVYW